MAELMEQGLADHETLVIGLGSHKCGSTWLYQYLRYHPDCFASTVKELNFFRSQYSLNRFWLLKQNMKKSEEAIKNFTRINPDFDADDPAATLNLEFLKLNDAVYDYTANAASLTLNGDYFGNFRRRNFGQTHMVDISPSYCLCDDLGFQMMKAAHHNVKFIFVMRDPIERAFSAYRYHYKTRKRKIAPRPRVRRKQLGEYFEEQQNADLYTDYGTILDKIERNLDPEQVFIGFYENLFNDDTMGKLCAFLGIEFKPGKYDEFVHKTDSEGIERKINEFERPFLVERFAHVYKDIEKRFGPQAPESWNWP